MRFLCIFAVVLMCFGGCVQGKTDHHDIVNSGLNGTMAPPLRYNIVQQKFNTQEDFHHIVLKPDYFKLDFPGYVIGIEKVSKRAIDSLALKNCAAPNIPCIDTYADKYADQKHISEWTRNRFYSGMGLHRDWKTMALTHLAEFGEKDRDAKILYNLYNTRCVDQDKPPAPGFFFDLNQTTQAGWNFLQTDFKTSLAHMIEDQKATHIFVIAMGWNTSQWAALTNFSDIQRNIIKAASDPKKAAYSSQFNPIFIGITWPSYWNKKPGPVEDYPNKSLDADKIGLGLANLLINGVIGSLKREKEKEGNAFKTVLLGHSLGSRLLTRAAASGYLLPDSRSPKIDLVIGLESAFGIERFIDPEDGAYLIDFKNSVKHSYYTVSALDSAMGVAPKYIKKYYMGAHPTFIAAQNGKITKYAKQHYENRWKNPKDIFEFAVLNGKGKFKNAQKQPSDKIVLVDGSEIINEITPGTAGGAHSDIFSPEMGTFIWETVKLCTMDNN